MNAKLNVAAMKGTVAKLLTAGFVAGAVALAVPAKASAQEVYFGARTVQFDNDRRAYGEHERIEALRVEQLRREEWRRDRGFYDRGFYDRDGRFRDHDDRRFDRDHFKRDREHFDHDRRFDR